ncbi:MAG TPA: hypothetical protein VFG51_00210 [Candidatus Saccharimonadia bacterium]|nr:hypothetical protein [Candidatus Saccharimonadia bacterium]
MKRKKKTTPTQRSLKKLRDEGWTAAVVEKWNPHVGIRQDLWGFGDLLCFKDDVVLIVQTTVAANVATRLLKIEANPITKRWIASQYRLIVVHGWSKRGARGKRKLWTCREVYYAGDPKF